MELNEAKSEENRMLRGFGFEIAYEFDWRNAIIRVDDRKDCGEVRLQAYGWAHRRRLAIVYTERPGGIRIRRMHDKEALKYGI